MTRFASILALGGLFVLCGAADSYAGSAGRCGGTGGTQTRNLTCPTGHYVAAIGARAGLYVDEFSLACRKIPATGAAGELGNFMSAGPGGGTNSKSDTCDKGHAVTTITFRSGGFIDTVFNGHCSKRSGSGWGTERDSNAGVTVGNLAFGVDCDIVCPVGEAMYKVTVKYGGVVDSIKGQCRR